jgi:cell division ATPase FtsA
MSDTLRIAAFDIGTNKIVGAVAERTDDGHLSILAIEEEINKNGIVNKGIIINVGEVVFNITSIIRKLQNIANTKIHNIYVSISNEKGYNTDEWEKLVLELASRGVKSHILDRMDCMADSLMSAAEKEIGCLLIDSGASCTSFILRTNNEPDIRGIVQLGGNNITKDLTYLELKYDDAEKLKTKLGSAKPDKLLRPNARIILEKSTNVNEAKYTTPLKLSEMILDRVKDIYCRFLDPLKKQDKLSKPGRSIILVGGASYLNNLPEWISDQTGLSVKIEDKFSFAESPNYVNIYNAKYACLISLLNNATEDCRKKDEELENTKKAKSSFWKKTKGLIEDGMTSIFGNDQYN